MKKLMIAAALVCAATFSHGAASQWQDWTIGTKSFLMSDGTTKPNGTTVYLIDTGAESYAALLTILTDGGEYANLAAVLAGTEFTGASIDSASTYSSTTTAKVNQYYGQVKDGKASLGTSETAIGSDYAILVADGENYLISQSVSGLSYTEDPGDGAAIAFGSAQFATANSISGGWQTYTAGGSPVPEPTSGLLMLLGVAGLALRRRRA